jgi:hypothetical protein
MFFWLDAIESFVYSLTGSNLHHVSVVFGTEAKNVARKGNGHLALLLTIQAYFTSPRNPKDSASMRSLSNELIKVDCWDAHSKLG